MNYGDPVSIIVVSYNSSKTVIETLNSIYEQDYELLELIITDDCSSDSTVSIIKKWLVEHSERFINVHLNVQEVNSGTSNNVIAGRKLVSYEWTKSIAADDILLKTCISDNVKFVINNNCESIVCSNMICFKDDNGKRMLSQPNLDEVRYLKKLSSLSSNNQYKQLIRRDTISSPTMFINMKMYNEIGGYDNRIKYIEDWPFKIKLTKFGNKIYYMNKTTVMYRMGESVTHNMHTFFNIRHLKQKKELKRLLCYPEIPKWDLLYYYNELMIEFKQWVIIRIFNNKKNKLTKVANILISLCIISKWRQGLNQLISKLIQTSEDK